MLTDDDLESARKMLESCRTFKAMAALLETAFADIESARRDLEHRIRRAKALVAAIKPEDEGNVRAHFIADGGAGAWEDFRKRVAGISLPEG